NSFYFVQNGTVGQFNLTTGALSSLGALPPATAGFRVFGVGDDLFVTGSSIVSRFRISIRTASVFAGLQPTAPIRDTAESSFPNATSIWSNGNNVFFSADKIYKIDLAGSTLSVFNSNVSEPHGMWGDGTY